MARASIIEALGDIARDKGISRERLQEVIQEAVTAAARRKYKNYNEVEARINETSGELEVFRYKTVTDSFADPENEIPLDEARKLDSAAEPGDEVEYEIDNQDLSRVIAQTARQLIFQKIREAERETIYENFKDRKGEILNGIVSRTERNRIFVTFNQVEAILYKREQIPNERYSSGEHVRVMLLDVINDPKEPSQLVISRADPLLLTKLFEMEVPEIYDGIVEIVAAAREAGRRAKIAVRSNDQDVDPVGACVGMRGSRVQSIISELRGEKIDIINWTDELPTYIANALAPAELTRIRIDDELLEVDVEVEPDQLSLAIGRQGQNVRLASKLIGYKININSTQDKALTLEEQIRERLLASQAQLAQQGEENQEGVELSGDEAPAEETVGVETTGSESIDSAGAKDSAPEDEPGADAEAGQTVSVADTTSEDESGVKGAAFEAVEPEAGQTVSVAETTSEDEPAVKGAAFEVVEPEAGNPPPEPETVAESSAEEAPVEDERPAEESPLQAAETLVAAVSEAEHSAESAGETKEESTENKSGVTATAAGETNTVAEENTTSTPPDVDNPEVSETENA